MTKIHTSTSPRHGTWGYAALRRGKHPADFGPIVCFRNEAARRDFFRRDERRAHYRPVNSRFKIAA